MNKTGHMVVREKHRGERRAALKHYIKETFNKYPNPVLDILYIAYTTYDEEIHNYVVELIGQYHKFDKIQVSSCSCNCSVHSGRNATAVFYMCE